jgi:hypothetical protein
MSSGQRMYFGGTFSLASTVTVNVNTLTLDARGATLNSTASIALDVTSSGVTILGGHWVGPNTGTAQAIRFMYAQNCVLRGADIEAFPSYFGAVSVAFNSGLATIENCWVHDNGAGTPCINISGNTGHNQVLNCKLGNSGMGVMVNSGGVQYDQILGCEFYGWETGSGTQCHGIYLDGQGGSDEGHNIISGCSFHDPHDGAGIVVKCQSNCIRDNTFYNFPTNAAVGISLYSQYSSCTANDNEIYGNTFTDMYYGIWIGQDASFTLSPTLRNRYHDNVFTRVTICFGFLSNGPACVTSDTDIYYNTFSQCTTGITCLWTSTPYVTNTTIAYNNFGGAAVTQVVLTSCTNTMVYGNTGLADFNVPAVQRIPPPSSPAPTPSPTSALSLAPGAWGKPIAFPNPYKAQAGAPNQIVFSGLGDSRTEIRIYTLAGRLVRTIAADPVNGTIHWDLKDEGAAAASGGVYLFVITNTAGEKITGKLAIVR